MEQVVSQVHVKGIAVEVLYSKIQKGHHVETPNSAGTGEKTVSSKCADQMWVALIFVPGSSSNLVLSRVPVWIRK